MVFFIALVAAKGDWPYVRKAYHLNCGFNCTRKCHLCPGDEAEADIAMCFGFVYFRGLYD